jgi:hypothetical protein
LKQFKGERVTPATTIDQLRSGFLDPPMSAAPMMRWWWFGPSVDRAEIRRELEVMATAGIGGVEVAYTYPLDPDPGTFLSDEFLADLRYAADAAAELGLRFDLTLGSGWSFGGPHITEEYAARRLSWERHEIPPAAARIPASVPWPGDELIAAYLGTGSLQEPPEDFRQLTVTQGAIDIPAGAGPRVVLLAYARLTGQNVKRAASGAEGPVLDHYSAAAAQQHLRQVGDRLLDAVPAQLLGSVFCDSLEVYGSDWTPELVREFTARRGYDPLPSLFLLVADGPDATGLRADYHRTLAELYEENFVAEFQRWSAARGVPFRIQGYGTPPATISSYRAADLFEGEGWGWTELTQTRWASSAAHLYGRDVVSSEVWTWVHSPSFRATPLDLLGEAHEHLLAGINQFIGHGWPYSPPDAPGLGWFFYASAALDDRNPWWPAMSPLVRYLTRLCWLMRQGRPVSDVLVYVGDQDVFARMGTGTGGSLDAWREARQVVGDEVIGVIRRGGWDYDLVDDHGLEVVAADDPRPVIISGATALSPSVQAWFADFTASGGTVITMGATVDVPGATVCPPDDLAATLMAGGARGVRLDPPGGDIGVVHRRTSEFDAYLVINTGSDVQTFTLTPRTPRRWYEEWSAHSGQTVRTGREPEGIKITLNPYQATVLLLGDDEPGPAPSGHDHDHGASRTVLLADAWQVQFPDQGAGYDVALPHVWENEPGRLGFSGSASYRRTVNLDDLGPSSRVVLTLGEASTAGREDVEPGGIRGHSYRVELEPPVGVMAEIRVNDVDFGTVWAPPYTVDVSQAVRPGDNQIEIIVRNTAANALAADQHIKGLVADSERRYGRRFRMQELDRALAGVRSGLLAVPSLLISG